MSSIRLFVLSALAERGPMHGHALRALAEEEHVDRWTDITVGALYGALKRMLADGSIEIDRVEREGNYPERQVYRVTDVGRTALVQLHAAGLNDIGLRPDPVDLAVARLDPGSLTRLEAVVAERLARYRRRLTETTERSERIAHHLWESERLSMRHTIHRLRAEVEWHEELLSAVPAIIDDEAARARAKGQKP